ncbi:signal peptidase II [Trichlorobacter ammonificans]|uniref:signal peptidase II n=1 Tax=Trichlorobacter ammonificans TaxID=2916410 RepID=UPI002737DD45|nr:signal peptidase II [Trichlorobacter ammonificans]
MAHWRSFISIVLLGLVVDQATKLYIHGTMALYHSIPVIDGFFSITYLRNRGAAFSFLADAHWRLPFFILVTLVACVAILVVVHRTQREQRLARTALAMIFSGAVGNLIDRVRLGEVIDFLDVYWKNHHWPAFNVADSLICVGVALMVFEMLREERAAAKAG